MNYNIAITITISDFLLILVHDYTHLYLHLISLINENIWSKKTSI